MGGVVTVNTLTALNENILQPDGVGDGNFAPWSNEATSGPATDMEVPVGPVATLRVWMLFRSTGTPVLNPTLKVNGSSQGNQTFSLHGSSFDWGFVDFSAGWASVTKVEVSPEVNTVGGDTLDIECCYVEAIK